MSSQLCLRTIIFRRSIRARLSIGIQFSNEDFFGGLLLWADAVVLAVVMGRRWGPRVIVLVDFRSLGWFASSGSGGRIIAGGVVTTFRRCRTTRASDDDGCFFFFFLRRSSRTRTSTIVEHRGTLRSFALKSSGSPRSWAMAHQLSMLGSCPVLDS